jgi:hypothetical protein
MNRCDQCGAEREDGEYGTLCKRCTIGGITVGAALCVVGLLIFALFYF